MSVSKMKLNHLFVGRMIQLRKVQFFQYHEQVQKYSTTLETSLFTPDLDPHILDVFLLFVTLRA
ncbi:hypothetical protein E2986_12287 [Frieseomelitta varia]|uniref:Uncharacterized protein n=1 Tax=Frieseomelitta varia TaxID=561572 RepID=A0A833S5L3_9HYME|nr:nuclear cap-binding protein subunit 1-like [Frieseomelitta varia]KAF3425165.1 hypothetical protein E2986_12287 [Frieseomelitta varia]